MAYKDLGEFNENREIEKHVFIKDKAFIIDVIGYSHFHFIYDKIAQYEFIKKYIPDLQLYIISSYNFIDKPGSIVEELKTIYKIPRSNIFSIDSGERFIFKNLYFIWSTHNDVLTGSFHKEYFDPWQKDREDFKFYIQTIYPLLQERFKEFLELPITIYNKYYISRFKQHENSGRNKNEFRYISKEDELKLEQFFADIGYKICTAEDLGLIEQIRLYSNASHIAALKSSALVNTIFCSKDTQIIGINLDDEYQVWYDYICLDAGLKYLELPPMTKDGEPTLSYSVYKEKHKRVVFSIDQIIQELKNNDKFLNTL